MERGKRPRVSFFSNLYGADKGDGLNGMPPQMDVEDLVLLRLQAEEALAKLDPESDHAQRIREALDDLLRSHRVADDNYECNNRDPLREYRMVS